uniref:ORF-83 n=1 Tax=Buzura suppressaria nuclear polyhedrosis virus TaxID=74320 RepID=A0A0N7CTP2_NPVBS|nr:ORF-83 [Buzura suppressaria nucleopolyhedrovirus]QYF10565.1 per os infectivity factor 7 [Buzura suppressaria nucleopolyhedrovirus]
MVYIILVTFVFIVAVIGLFTLRINRNQLARLVYYQYNYIPEHLVSLVKVHNLKPTNGVFE